MQSCCSFSTGVFSAQKKRSQSRAAVEGNSLYQNEHVIPVGRRTNRLCLLLIKQNPSLPRFSFAKLPVRDVPGVRCGFVLQRTFGKVHFRFSRCNWGFLLFVPFDFFSPSLSIFFFVRCKHKIQNKTPVSLLPPRQRFGRRRAKGSQNAVLREGTSAAVASQQREKGTSISFHYFILFLFYCIVFFSEVGNAAAVLGNTLSSTQKSPLPVAFVPNGSRAQRCSRCTQQLQEEEVEGWEEERGGEVEIIPGAPEQNCRFHSGFSSPFQKRFPARGERFANAEAPKPEPSAAARGNGTVQPHPVLDPPRASATNIYPEFRPC